jgi:hypothetical protein
LKLFIRHSVSFNLSDVLQCAAPTGLSRFFLATQALRPGLGCCAPCGAAVSMGHSSRISLNNLHYRVPSPTWCSALVNRIGFFFLCPDQKSRRDAACCVSTFDCFAFVGYAAAAPSAQGSRTTLVQWSCLSRNTLYISGALSIGTRWLTTKLGSISPRSMRSSNGCM